MMMASQDGPYSPQFRPIAIAGNASLEALAGTAVSEEMAAVGPLAPSGACTAWGLPFTVGRVVVASEGAVTLPLDNLAGEWLVFMHTSDARPILLNDQGFPSPMRGEGRLGELAAHYVIQYADGEERRIPIRRRREIGAYTRRWGENCSECVAHRKPVPKRAHHEQDSDDWGRSQTRATAADAHPWTNWLYAWRNPRPDQPIVGLRIEPAAGTLVLSGLACGAASAHPLRWLSRKKAVLTLPEDQAFDPTLDANGLLGQIRLDMGQVISATPRPIYPVEDWAENANNALPEFSAREILIEYTAHPDARLHLASGETIMLGTGETVSVGNNETMTLIAMRMLTGENQASDSVFDTIRLIAAATQRVTLRTVDAASGQPVAVKMHVHGEAGEYLAPVDRHRIPNGAWFEDYSVDFTHLNRHHCTYISGETRIDLPLGRVFIEVSKGFEIRPVRQVVEVTPDTDEITIELARVLPWRERGWVSADTHVHFLSPPSALLEGAGEGVNVVNLLASQWGELMTNVGDFDGQTTYGSRETGGDGEHLVRVGTENRQHVMGHISLLGYGGNIIAPMTTGGPDESALGDPIEILLTEWARQCHRQGGLVVLPHFPNPRMENAAAIVEGEIDAVEMTSWGNLYGGIDPYTLADWYRYLNCGYMVAAVGGTDKMAATTAVGTVRTYARIPDDRPFDYAAWMDAVRAANTFVTYGPLIEFCVEGHPAGSRLSMSATGGTVDIAWELASVTVPMSGVELVVNGEIVESVAVAPDQASGHWSVPIRSSAWLALLVRGHYADKPEIIAAHSSPVMIEVAASPFRAAADAVTILDQIEGALAYLDTIGTRAETTSYRRMRLVLESAHRKIHNRMHSMGHYHEHTPVEDHPEHH